jgi:hypothetical protein
MAGSEGHCGGSQWRRLTPLLVAHPSLHNLVAQTIGGTPDPIEGDTASKKPTAPVFIRTPLVRSRLCFVKVGPHGPETQGTTAAKKSLAKQDIVTKA